MSIRERALKVLAWTWTVIAGLLALSLLVEGVLFGSVALAVSGFASCPPVWSKLGDAGYSLSTRLRSTLGFGTFLVGMFVTSSATESIEPRSQADAAQSQPDKALAVATAESSEGQVVPAHLASAFSDIQEQVAEHAVIEMRPADYPKLHERVGNEAFERANALATWAAIAAASDPRCGSGVDLLAVSDTSTGDEIRWFGDCGNGQQIKINEGAATETRDLWTNPNATLADVTGRASRPVTLSANALAVQELDTSDKAEFLGKCERAVATTLTSRGSFDPAWSYDYRTHSEEGQVSIVREFDADNALGGTISSQYECVIDAHTRSLVRLRIQEPTGWRTLLSR
ncbi:MAG: hypothetical protein AAF941_02045 [Pseudomonadota bacterium]